MNQSGTRRSRGATLLELLVGSVILFILLGLVFTITTQTSTLWKNTNSQIGAFQDARAAFDALTRNLGQATLNHYYDYYDNGWNRRTSSAAAFIPSHYGRYSELQYISGPVDQLFGAKAGARQSHALFFQAPLGRVDNKTNYANASSLINALGYYVEYGPNTGTLKRPKFLQSSTAAPRENFRLMEWVQPAEKFRLYDTTLSASDPLSWFITPIEGGTEPRMFAEDIVALIVQPKSDQDDTALAPEYHYDSNPATDLASTNYDPDRSHLLPPLIQVTLVAIDRVSAERLKPSDAAGLYSPDLFKNASGYATDLQKLENALKGSGGKPKLNYRVFTTTVATREHNG